MKEDTVKLLAECDAGIQMAVSAINDVLPSTENAALRRHLYESRNAHETLRKQTLARLHALQAEGKAPNPIAKSMSRLKTGVRLTVNPDDKTVADLIVSGCNMGVKSLHRYQNQYAAADSLSREVADQLIGLELELAQELYPYL